MVESVKLTNRETVDKLVDVMNQAILASGLNPSRVEVTSACANIIVMCHLPELPSMVMVLCIPSEHLPKR